MIFFRRKNIKSQDDIQDLSMLEMQEDSQLVEGDKPFLGEQVKPVYPGDIRPDGESVQGKEFVVTESKLSQIQIGSSVKTDLKNQPFLTSDDAVPGRRRGRPKGSKNKKKPLLDPPTPEQQKSSLGHTLSHEPVRYDTSDIDKLREDLIYRACLSRDLSSQRALAIVHAARLLYERQGYSKTSVKDITEHMGISRTLFYHYFENKEAVTRGVMDSYITDFIESIIEWNETRVTGDTELAIGEAVQLIRTILTNRGNFRMNLASKENAELYLEFQHRAAELISQHIADTTMRTYAERHQIEIEYMEESLYLLIVGICAYMRSRPDADEDMLKTLIAQTLHLRS